MEKLAAQTGLIGSGSIIGVGGLLYFFLRSQTEDLHEDVALVLRISRLKRRMKKLSYRQNWTIADLFESVARKNKDKEAIYFIDTETSYTYGQVDEISNQSLPFPILLFLFPPIFIDLTLARSPQSPTGRSKKDSRKEKLLPS